MSLARLAFPYVVLAGLFSSVAHSAPVPESALANAQLRAINHRFVDAYLNPGVEFIDSLTDDDFLLTANDGAWLDRADFLRQIGLPSKLDGASYDNVEVRLYGDVALVQGVFRSVRASEVGTVRYTDVYVWNGAAWRLVSAQNTPVKPGSPIEQRHATGPALTAWKGMAPQGDDDAVLRALNQSYVQAFRDADASWYDAHLAPDYTVVYGDGSYHDRAAALVDFAVPSFATHLKSFPLDKVRIRRFGDTALIHAENAYERKDGRKGVNRYTDIWVKRDGRWLCVSAHITVHKAPA